MLLWIGEFNREVAKDFNPQGMNDEVGEAPRYAGHFWGGALRSLLQQRVKPKMIANEVSGASMKLKRPSLLRG